MEYKTNKEEQFDSIYRTYEDDIYKISLFYTKDEHVAREITQRTFFKFYLHMDQADIESIRAYLVRIARNLSFNYLRDHKRRQYELEMCELESAGLSGVSLEESYIKEETRLRQKQLSENILEHLREENELWYETINLVCCLGKSQELVAKELGVSKEVIYSRMYRARRWIQKHYGEEFDEVVGRS